MAVAGKGASRWALTERGRSAVSRDASTLAIGQSSVRWAGGGERLVFAIDERSAPWNRPVRGRISFYPELVTPGAFDLDRAGAHQWWPVAPFGRVEVDLDEPRLRFRGTGYFDQNRGSEPLEQSFSSWSWMRLAGARDVHVAYDCVGRKGALDELSLRIDRTGVHHESFAPAQELRGSRFGLQRTSRAPKGVRLGITRTLEDGPFYVRSRIEGRRGAERLAGVHETVSLERLAQSWVRFLIPFRMRREAA